MVEKKLIYFIIFCITLRSIPILLLKINKKYLKYGNDFTYTA